MKTMIQQTAGNRVQISYNDSDTGERLTREFSVRSDGKAGYVREGERQVCDRLSSTGNTLLCTCDELLSVIRREYRAMRRAEQAIDRARY
jgi:hypothetical protein